jgi:hypothetical protein
MPPPAGRCRWRYSGIENVVIIPALIDITLGGISLVSAVFNLGAVKYVLEVRVAGSISFALALAIAAVAFVAVHQPSDSPLKQKLALVYYIGLLIAHFGATASYAVASFLSNADDGTAIVYYVLAASFWVRSRRAPSLQFSPQFRRVGSPTAPSNAAGAQADRPPICAMGWRVRFALRDGWGCALNAAGRHPPPRVMQIFFRDVLFPAVPGIAVLCLSAALLMTVLGRTAWCHRRRTRIITTTAAAAAAAAAAATMTMTMMMSMVMLAAGDRWALRLLGARVLHAHAAATSRS